MKGQNSAVCCLCREGSNSTYRVNVEIVEKHNQFDECQSSVVSFGSIFFPSLLLERVKVVLSIA